jgi:pimeloyl-ACP methyl ester carboxylesterase
MAELSDQHFSEIVVIKGVLEGYQRTDRSNDRCIVLVHGLTGHRLSTWKEKSSKGFVELFTQDTQVEDFDVFSFGYRTSYWRGAPINNAAVQLANALNELAQKRPYQIVFIAHSMGGLVCMRYILDQLDRGMIPPITGLLLYGTPITGTDLIKVAKLVGFGIGSRRSVTWPASPLSPNSTG